MSNFLAIATVSASLRQALEEAVAADVPGATVIGHRPDAARPHSAPAVNVYLYQVTPNAAWRNADLPTRRGAGRPIQRPRAAFDVHYLLSFYGDDSNLEPERLLGSVVRRLHEHPVLARGMIERTVADPGFGFLAGSDLADENELVKFAPSALSLEELSKLWSVFFQTPYVLSTAYQGTVVLIDGKTTPRPSLPVRRCNLQVAPLRRPVIEEVVPENGSEQPILADSRLRIRGTGLRGDEMRVRIRGSEVPAEVVSDAEIIVDLASVTPGRLRAGVQPVQVVHLLSLGTPPTPHRGAESNAAAIVLRPTVVSVSMTAPPPRERRPRPRRPQPRRPQPRRRTPPPEVTVEVRPAVGKDQRVALLLRQLTDEEANSYTLFTSPREEDGEVIEFSVAGVTAGDYLVAVQVDGAESPLEADADPESPTFGRYVSPSVRIE